MGAGERGGNPWACGAACLALLLCARAAHADEPEPASADRSIEMVYLRSPVPKSAFELVARPVYSTWLTGEIGPANANQVFSSGWGIALEAGYRFGRRSLLYGGWERVGYGVGTSSPYTTVSSASAHGDRYLLGWRFDFVLRPFGIFFDVAGGFDQLAQNASDGKGGTASVTYSSPTARLGFGASVRAIERRLAIEPTLQLGLSSFSKYSTSAQPANGQAVDVSGTVHDGTVGLALVAGIGGAFDLPLSWE